MTDGGSDPRRGYRSAPRVRLRSGRPSDTEAVREVHRRAVAELGSQAYDDEQVAAWNHGRDEAEYPLDEDGVTFVVAERVGDERAGGGEEDAPDLVGFGEVRPHGGDYFEAAPPDYGEVRAVYVHPDAARAGVGSKLLDRLERTARRERVRGLALQASLNAVPFYERRGYDELARLDHEFGDTGVTGTVVEMAKGL